MNKTAVAGLFATNVALMPRQPKSPMTRLRRVTAQVEGLLRKIAGGISDGGTFQYSALRARQIDDAIEVTIPDISVQLPDGSYFELAKVLALVRRRDTRFDDISLTLPGKIPFRNGGGTRGRIIIGSRLAELTWDHELDASTTFELRLGEIAIVLDAGGAVGRIGEILANADLVESQGLWFGPVGLSLNQLDWGADDRAGVCLQRAGLAFDLRGLDLRGHAAPLQSLSGDDPTPDSRMQSLKRILSQADGIGLRANLAGLSAQGGDQGDFQLADAAFGLDLSSPDKKHLFLTLTARHGGLGGSGGDLTGIIPREMDIALSLDSLPIDTLVKVGLAALLEVALLGDITSGAQVLARLRENLGAAGTALRLQRARLAATGYDIAATLNLHADKAPAAGFVGGGMVRIRGLKTLLAAVGRQYPPRLSKILKSGQHNAPDTSLQLNYNIGHDGRLTINDDAILSLVPFPDQAE